MSKPTFASKPSMFWLYTLPTVHSCQAIVVAYEMRLALLGLPALPNLQHICPGPDGPAMSSGYLYSNREQ